MSTIHKDICCVIFHNILMYKPSFISNILYISKFYYYYCIDIITQHRNFLSTGLVHNWWDSSVLIPIPERKLVSVINVMRDNILPYAMRTFMHCSFPISFKFSYVTNLIVYNIYKRVITIEYFNIVITLIYNQKKFVLYRDIKYREVKPVLDFLRVYMNNVYRALAN